MKKIFWKSLLAFSLSAILCLALTEAILRYGLKILPENYGGIFAADSKLGYRNQKNFQGRLSRADAHSIASTNSLGMRGKDQKIAKSSDDFRILFLGDSFAFGFGVQDEETAAVQLENLLNKDSERAFAAKKQVQVWNAGVISYGSVQEAIYLSHNLNEINPDLVVILFYIDDPEQNAALFKFMKGTAPAPSLPGTGADLSFGNWIRRNSSLAFLITAWIEQSGWRTPFPRREFVGSYYNNENSYVRDAWNISQDIFGVIARELAEKNIPLVVAWVPEPLQFQGDAGHRSFERVYHFPGETADKYDADLPRRRFLAMCKEIKLNCFDPSAIFGEKFAKEKLFYNLDKHWTKDGQALFAKSLADYLTKQKF